MSNPHQQPVDPTQHTGNVWEQSQPTGNVWDQQSAAQWGQQPPQPQQQHAPMQVQPAPQGPNFFSMLFDLSFSRFITPKIIKLVYILGIVMTGLVVLMVFIASFATNDAAIILGFLIASLIGGFVNIVFLRVILEFMLATIRMSEDVHHRLPRA